MNRRLAIAISLIFAVALVACGRAEEAAPSRPAEALAPVTIDAPPVAEQLAADAAAVAQSCTQDCGNGVTTSIQCAAGETAVCDCANEPQASCELQPETAP